MKNTRVLWLFFGPLIVVLLSACASLHSGSAEFVVNVWSYSSLPDNLKKEVEMIAKCDRVGTCRSSAVLGKKLRACGDAGICKRSTVETVFFVQYVGKQPYAGEQLIKGRAVYVVPFGTEVSASLVSGNILMLPQGRYTLKAQEWSDRVMNSHFIVLS